MRKWRAQRWWTWFEHYYVQVSLVCVCCVCSGGVWKGTQGLRHGQQLFCSWATPQLKAFHHYSLWQRHLFTSNNVMYLQEFAMQSMHWKAEVENVRDGDATSMLWLNPGLHVWLENQSLEKLFHTPPVDRPQGSMWPHHLTRWQQHDPWPSHDQWLILPCLVILSIISKLELQFLEHAHICSIDS